MNFIDETLINQYTGAIIEAPALAKLNEISKENLQDVLKEFFKEVYLNRPKYVQNFMNYQADDEFINFIFKQYGIDKKYYEKLNPTFKKILVYFIERAYQVKGSLKSLNIFSEIFETIFGAINFYRIIVVKKPIERELNGVIQKDYYLIYELDPLYINNKEAILETFDDKVSLTGKHLMTLEQYKDFKFFPVNTNLIYIQFTSARSNIDNNKTFNFIVRAYGLTMLNKYKFSVKNFNGLYFTLDGADFEVILQYAEITRMRKFYNKDFNFYYNPYRASYNLIMADEHLDTLEEFLHEYQTLNYANRSEMINFKRRWKLFLSNYLTAKYKYHTYEELREYLNKKYPELINLIDSFETEDEFMNFYIEAYNLAISFIDLNDDILLLYINFIFLNLITGSQFIDNFFLPLYKLFQKYLFPIELDFLNKVTETLIIKDKFESVGTDETFKTSMYLKGFLSKRFQKPDIIKLIFTYKYKNLYKLYDQNKILVKTLNHDKLKYSKIIKMNLFSNLYDNKNIIDNHELIINIKNNDSKETKESISTIINPTINESKIFDENQSIHVKINNFTKQKFDEINQSLINVSETDSQSFSEEKVINFQRFDYTKLIDSLGLYLTFYKEQFRRLSAFEQNIYYKNTNQSDYLYFDFYDLF